MKTLIALWHWAHKPRWTHQAVIALYVAAFLFVYNVTYNLFPLLGQGWTLLSALLVPPAGVAVFFAVRAGRWVKQRIDVTTEAGVPLSPVRMLKELKSERVKFAEADDRWALAMRAQKVVYDGQSPKLHRHQLTATGDVRAHVNPAGLGGDLEAITRIAASGTLAGIMKCEEVSVQPSKGGAWVTFYKTPPFSRSFTLSDLPQSGKGRMSFGIEESGVVAAVRYGLSMLIVGATGSGKSILFKNMFADIRRDGQPTQMWFVDPKRSELRRFKSKVGHRIGNIQVMGYCNTGDEAAAMFQEFAAEMHERQERLAQMGVTELTKPTEDFPVRIVVIDEMIDVIGSFAKSGSPLHIAISQGRSTLDSVISVAQLAKIETLGSVRDLYSLRACMRTMTAENTKAVLGISESDGAPCSRIPLSMPGVGYYITDEGLIRKFRTAKVTDQQWTDMVDNGGLPEGMPVNVENVGPPCFGYIGPERGKWCGTIGCRHPKCCGYVGISSQFDPRRPHKTPVELRREGHRKDDWRWCKEHDRAENWWNRHIIDTRLEVVGPFPSRAAAKIWEERTIKQLKPRWNIQHNGDNPDSNENLSRRAGIGWRLRDATSEWRELGREVSAVRQVRADFAKQDRVKAQVEKRDRFVENVERSRFMADSGAGSMR